MSLLEQEFYSRPALDVAEDLLGKVLVRRWRGNKMEQVICEVEAYDGFEDKASHASKGKTKRNAVMFGPAGVWYVYLCYGMHWMLNVVTGKIEYPAAVLIRGTREVSGPGRLTKALHVSGAQNGKRAETASKLWIKDAGIRVSSEKIKFTPRIGVDYAEEWAQKKYRFVWRG